MAQTAEELGDRYEVTREYSDEVAHRSHVRARAAGDEGRFADEVVPVTIRTRKGEKEFAADEHIRPDVSLEGLARLRPYFRKGGLVTAGNASGIGDGSASTVIADAEWAAGEGLSPIGRLVSWAFVGVEPRIMGIGPAPAARAALGRGGPRARRHGTGRGQRGVRAASTRPSSVIWGWTPKAPTSTAGPSPSRIRWRPREPASPSTCFTN